MNGLPPSSTGGSNSKFRRVQAGEYPENRHTRLERLEREAVDDVQPQPADLLPGPLVETRHEKGLPEEHARKLPLP